MDDILSLRSKIAARIGFDITNFYVISCMELDDVLKHAAACGLLNVVKYLVEEQNINAQALNDAVKAASHKGHWNMVEYLIDKGAYNKYGLYEAAAAGNLHMVKYFVTKTQCQGDPWEIHSAWQWSGFYKQQHISEYLEGITTSPISWYG